MSDKTKTAVMLIIENGRNSFREVTYSINCPYSTSKGYEINGKPFIDNVCMVIDGVNMELREINIDTYDTNEK